MDIKTKQGKYGQVYHLTMSEQEVEDIQALLQYMFKAIAENNDITIGLRNWCLQMNSLQGSNKISEGLRDMGSMILTASTLLHLINMNKKEESHGQSDSRI